MVRDSEGLTFRITILGFILGKWNEVSTEKKSCKNFAFSFDLRNLSRDLFPIY